MLIESHDDAPFYHMNAQNKIYGTMGHHARGQVVDHSCRTVSDWRNDEGGVRLDFTTIFCGGETSRAGNIRVGCVQDQ
jgi:hypothetical protein